MAILLTYSKSKDFHVQGTEVSENKIMKCSTSVGNLWCQPENSLEGQSFTCIGVRRNPALHHFWELAEEKKTNEKKITGREDRILPDNWFHEFIHKLFIHYD